MSRVRRSNGWPEIVRADARPMRLLAWKPCGPGRTAAVALKSQFLLSNLNASVGAGCTPKGEARDLSLLLSGGVLMQTFYNGSHAEAIRRGRQSKALEKTLRIRREISCSQPKHETFHSLTLVLPLPCSASRYSQGALPSAISLQDILHGSQDGADLVHVRT